MFGQRNGAGDSVTEEDGVGMRVGLRDGVGAFHLSSTVKVKVKTKAKQRAKPVFKKKVQDQSKP